ncbi:MAG: DMT family transporter [Burkholderiales bacterium]
MTRSAPFLVLAGGVAVVSTASILIRYAQAEAASSAAIAAGRLAIAAIVLAPLAWSRAGAELTRLSRRDLALCAVSGVFLALHFWTWIASLEYTSVASSTALVTTNPIWVALTSAWLLNERPNPRQVAGIILTLAGTALIFAAASAATQARPAPLLGNTLALVGALAATGYLLLGRALRSRVGLLAYIWLAYSFAALVLLVAAFASGENLGSLNARAWFLILALALGPQLLGHTAFNWALRRLSATFVAISILGEPVGSALLAWWLLGEHFTALQFGGFAVVLIGIFAAARGEAANRSAAAQNQTR